MKDTARQFGELVLRGFGQMFVTNNVVSGALYALALFIVAPKAAILSVLAAMLATGLALVLFGPTSSVRSGLFGVNGALLGAFWIYAPEVPWTVSWPVTAAGTLAIVALLHSSSEWLKRRQLALTPFSLPYVIVAWCCLAILAHWQIAEPQLPRGWEALRRGDLAEAEEAFSAANPHTERGLAYQADGLGWVNFRRGDNLAACAHFEQALVHWPELADALDGLGWSQYRLGAYEAAYENFRAAIGHDRWLADSWNGLGWLALGVGATDEAERCFRRAACSAPLCADAYTGWQSTASLTEQEVPERVAQRLQTWTSTYVARRYQWTTLPQCCAWLLFAVGILWHSRWSAAVATAGVTVSIIAARACGGDAWQTLDDVFIMNIVAINVALAGHYFKPGLGSTAWAWLVSALVTVAWASWHAWGATHGLPLLCAPFNLALVGSLALAGSVERHSTARLIIPLEVAVTSPARVWIWTRQRDIAGRCWRYFATPKAAPSSRVEAIVAHAETPAATR
jgi:urea transporter